MTKKQIRKMLAVAGFYGRAVVLVLKSTGLSVGDLSRLRVRQIGQDLAKTGGWRSWLHDGNVPVSVRGKREKTKRKFQTFLDSEAVGALRTYWTQREKGTRYRDNLGRGVPPDKLTDESHVFLKKTILCPGDGYYFSRFVKDLMQRADVKGVSAHIFRKYFQTTLETPELGIHANWIRLMMGHKLRSGWDLNPAGRLATHPAYSQPTDQAMRDAFTRAMPYLSVLSRHIDEERFTSLEKMLQDERRLRKRDDERILLLERTLRRLLELEKQTREKQGP